MPDEISLDPDLLAYIVLNKAARSMIYKGTVSLYATQRDIFITEIKHVIVLWYL
jgi:hypothetical protein